MDLYGEKSKSLPQKTVIFLAELLLLWLSYWILFQGGDAVVFGWLGMEASAGVSESRMIIFAFSVVVFLRVSFTMFYLLNRKIPWEESISIPFAFALYYIGFALFVVNRSAPIDWLDYAGVFIFFLGSFLNTSSEIQRHIWKKEPQNKGKLYTIGLFKYAMHINYFGDILWVCAYAILARNYYSIAIPLFLFCFFVFYNIPLLDKYLAEKYKEQFDRYREKTKKLIPFIY